MAAAAGRKGPALIEQLFHEPHRFDFFQAVRLLERASAGREPVGGDAHPEREAVRFRAWPSLTFPTAAVAGLERGEPAELTVGFLGLTGSAGVLPHHYTALLLTRLRARDFSLRDFLDLFNNRLAALYYRAWEKYRLPAVFERSRRRTLAEPDPVTKSLFCVTGLGTEGLRSRLEVDPAAVLYYGGLFARGPRPAVSLECMLEDYFGVPVRVLQLQGQWLNLEEADRGRLPPAGRAKGETNVLGRSLVVGRRVWDVQSKFRVRVGPLSYAQFRRLMPDGDALRPLARLTKLYAGSDLDFDVQPLLHGEEVPPLRLSAAAAEKPRLGWNTWLRQRPFVRPAGDAVFRPAEINLRPAGSPV
ncbi:MAG: type VI secretion system baseplate subunit TssG [Gemmataceae bacterium]